MHLYWHQLNQLLADLNVRVDETAQWYTKVTGILDDYSGYIELSCQYVNEQRLIVRFIIDADVREEKPNRLQALMARLGAVEESNRKFLIDAIEHTCLDPVNNYNQKEHFAWFTDRLRQISALAV